MEYYSREANPFVHLDVHTEYSLLNSIFKLEDIKKACIEQDFIGVGANDFNTLHKPFTFQKIMYKEPHLDRLVGVKFIVRGKYLDSFFTLLLYAKTYEGYLNLVKLSTIANSGGKPFPYIEYSDLYDYRQDLLCMTGGETGELFHLILNEEEEDAESFISFLSGLFGEEDLFIELTNHFTQDEKKVNHSVFLKNIVFQKKLQTVACNDVFYWKKEHGEHRDIGFGMNPNPEGIEYSARYVMYNHEFYFKSREEMLEAFKDILPLYPDCFENTMKIFNRCCGVKLKPQKVLPEFPIPDGYTRDSFFEHLVKEGLEKRQAAGQLDASIPYDSYLERLEYEISVIRQMGFVDYHMIVQDFINWAKDEKVHEHPERYFPTAYFPDYSKLDPVCIKKDFPIIVGPGRGSAAGSLVCYCLSITDIDPLANKLLFERFLNPERISMPDIDIDLPNRHRHYVVEYLQNKYGYDNVSQIATFQTLGVRSIIKSVGKKLGLPYAVTDNLTKNVPSSIVKEVVKEDGTRELVEKPVELLSELEDVEFFSSQIASDESLRELFRFGKVLEGLPISTGKHAAGCIICAVPIDSFVPLMEVDGVMVTQYEKHDAEDIGLLKMDLLGLLNLDIIEKSFEFIEHRYHKHLSIGSIPKGDKKTFELFQRGDTGNVFQFEGSGMRRLLQKIHPTENEHLNAACALYRPGPMQFIDLYLAGRQNPGAIHYPHESFKEVTEDTYGILVYQEQVMQLVQKMSGFTLGEADILRRGIGKKEEKLILENRRKFVEGGVRTSHLSEKKLDEIYDTICKFASYGFNRSHSCAYAWISYICGYLKANFPVCYMAACLTLYSEKAEKLESALIETRRMGIPIEAPDIRYSQKEFSIEPHEDGDHIRFSFEGIKGIGEELAGALEKIDDYDSFFACLTALPARQIRIDKIKYLIYAGVFDCFGPRKALVEEVDTYADSLKMMIQIRDAGVANFLSLYRFPDIAGQAEYPLYDRIGLEKGRIQIALSGHPVSAVRPLVEDPRLKMIPELAGAKEEDGEDIHILAILRDVHVIKTKKKHEDMAFLQIEDEFGEIEGVLFPGAYRTCGQRAVVDTPVILSGRCQIEEDKESFIVSDIRAVRLDDTVLYIRSCARARKLIPELRQKNGATPVVFIDTVHKKIEELDFCVAHDKSFANWLFSKGLQWKKDFLFVRSISNSGKETKNPTKKAE